MDGSSSQGQDMMSQQRLLQSYMENMFGNQAQAQNNPNGQQPMHPGMPAAFQHLAAAQQQQLHQSNAANANNAANRFAGQQPFHPGSYAASSMPSSAFGNPQNQQQQQQQQQNQGHNQQNTALQAALWMKHQQQPQQGQQQAADQQSAGRPLFPQGAGSGLQQQQSQQQATTMSQAEIQAMMSSLGMVGAANGPSGSINFSQALSALSSNANSQQQMPGTNNQNQYQQSFVPSFQLPQTQQHQQQQAFSASGSGGNASNNTNSTNGNAGQQQSQIPYSAQLQAAYQQLTSQSGQQQQQPLPPSQQMPFLQSQGSQQAASGPSTAGGQMSSQAPNGNGSQTQPQGMQFDPALLVKLRQSGMQLTPDQQNMLGRAMLRRGGVTGSNDGGQQQQQVSAGTNLHHGSGSANTGFQASPQAPGHINIPGAGSQGQQNAQQSTTQAGAFRTPHLPTTSAPLGLSNMTPASGAATGPASGNIQAMQQNGHMFMPSAAMTQLQQQGSLGFPPNMQNSPASQPPIVPGAAPIPLNVLQEFTNLSEKLRAYTNQEQHLAMCLAQNLHIPKQASGGNASQPPQPLTPQQRGQAEKALENIRTMLAQAREHLQRLEVEHGGKENIIVHLKAYANQRGMKQAQASNQGQGQLQTVQSQGPNQAQPQPPVSRPQQSQPQPPQSIGPTQTPLPQSAQQQQHAAAGNRTQMRTPVNGMQQQQQQQQLPGQPSPAQVHRGPPVSKGQQQPGNLAMQGTPQQIQRMLSMQGVPQAQAQPQGNFVPSPNPAFRNHNAGTSPNPGTTAMPSLANVSAAQQQPLQPAPGQTSSVNHANGIQNAATQAQYLRNQHTAVNEEILKTLAAAGPQAFMKALFETMMNRGTPIKSTPRVDGNEIDLVKLYRLVQQRGGCATIRQQGLWRQIALEHGLHVDAQSAPRIAEQLSQVYTEFLEPFEDLQRRAAVANYQRSNGQAVIPANPQVGAVQNGNNSGKPGNVGSSQRQQILVPANLQQSAGSDGNVSSNGTIPQDQSQNPGNLFQQHTQNQQQYLQNIHQLQQQLGHQPQPSQMPFAPGIPGLAPGQQLSGIVPSLPQTSAMNGNGSNNNNALPTSEALTTRPGSTKPNQASQNQQQANLARPQHQRTGSQSSVPTAAQQRGTPQQSTQGLPMRQPILPSQKEINKARADISQMQASLRREKPQYEVIQNLDPAEQERFIAMAKGIAPMVEKVSDLLPLYLAISQQTEGSRRLLIMMGMFKDQMPMLEQRQFILRVSDLEKLKIQMQRCWSFVSSSAQGIPPTTPQPGGEVQLPAGGVKAQPQGQQPMPGENGSSGFVATALKPGLRVEDLKPPPAKHRKTGSAGGTPTAVFNAATSGAAASPQAGQNIGGTGATYASPIALDSPSPAKPSEGGKSSNDSKPSKRKGSVDVAAQSPAAPAASKPRPKAKARAKQAQAKAQAQAQAQVSSQSQQAQGQSPAGGQSTAPTPAQAAPSAAGTPSQTQPQADTPASAANAVTASGDVKTAAENAPLMINSISTVGAGSFIPPGAPSAEQQAMSLKRKRELEDAQADPVAFSEQILSSYLASAKQANAFVPALPTFAIPQHFSASVAPAASEDISAEILSFLNYDFLQQQESDAPADTSSTCAAQATDLPTSKAQSLATNVSAVPSAAPGSIPFTFDNDSLAIRWPISIDTVSSIAETPDFGQVEDPTKTSPPDDPIATPQDPHLSLPNTATAAAFKYGVHPGVSAVIGHPAHGSASIFTKNLLSAFDEDYERLFNLSSPSTFSALPPAAPAYTGNGASTNGMEWSWDVGPVLTPQKSAVH